ncbi:replication-relaxation family protein [Neobacillus sp.]|uniref:replication-relaxation family protein n=1 Tax=Neobacillus sp. TaxID=2675273 RepID=UPI0035B567D0
MTILKYKIERGPKKIFWFTEQDLEVLRLIWEFKSLSLHQIKYYCEDLFNVKPKSIEKKLQRWREGKVVIAKPYTKRPGAKIYYRLGSEGVNVLKLIGVIRSDQRIELDELPSKRTTDHYLAIRDVVLLTLIQLKHSRDTVKSVSPSEHPYYEKGFEGTSPIVVPDWILLNKNGILNFEVDTGTENLNKLEEKVKKYVRYATQRSNEIHHVLITVIDENDPRLKYINDIPKDRSVRIANLKEVVLKANAHIYPNLFFWVGSVSRISKIAYNILTGDYSISAEKRSKQIKAITALFKLNATFNYEIDTLNADDFYLAEVNDDLYADEHLHFYGQEQETVLLKLMEEGSVKHLDQLDYLNRLQDEKRFKKKVDKVLAIYQDNDELHNDVLGKVFPHILFTSFQQLNLDLDDYPTVYQTVNTARKESVLLYER